MEYWFNRTSLDSVPPDGKVQNPVVLINVDPVTTFIKHKMVLAFMSGLAWGFLLIFKFLFCFLVT